MSPEANRHLEALAAMPAGVTLDDLRLHPSFKVAHDESRGLEVIYAPFDHVQHSAKLILCGITPGRAQADTALRVAHELLRAHVPVDDVLEAAKYAASFAGPMRRNLCAMLEEIGLHEHLGLTLRGCEELFETKRHLLHPTSAVRYPVLVNGENYGGLAPPLLSHPSLRGFVTDDLAPELASVPDAVIVPLGEAATGALRHLIANDALDASRVLIGFPHPSGGNGHRVRQWTERMDALREKLATWFAE